MFDVFLQIVVIRNQKVVHKEKVDFEPSAVAIDPSNSVVAVGSSQVSGQKFHLLMSGTFVHLQQNFFQV